jgi:molybdopterin/thiamine biosynthesis adenylyltransferase
VTIEIPSTLRDAILALDHLEGWVTVLGVWERFEDEDFWGLRFETLSAQGNTAIWYVLARANYPLGSIHVMPANKGGIELTYPHQQANRRSKSDVPWRQGKLCLAGPQAFVRRNKSTDEPLDCPWRLLWHLERTLEWINAAETGDLMRLGDPFELPDFSTSGFCTFVHQEPIDSLAFWSSRPERVGIFQFVRFAKTRNKAYCVVLRFLDTAGNEILAPKWGIEIANATKDQTLRGYGLWVRLDSIPFKAPWAAPCSWQDLDSNALEQGFDLPGLLSEALFKCIRNHNAEALLVGFPIPEVTGGKASTLHWQPISIPQIKRDKKGFAGASKPIATMNRLLGRDKSLGWLRTENWHPARLGSRGRVASVLANAKVCIIGVGALGGNLAQSMVRAGVDNLLIFDGDVIETVNLVRSPYSLNQLGFNKAFALADSLNCLSPHARVHSGSGNFPPSHNTEITAASDCNIVIDCTAENEALHHLAAFNWGREHLFVSFSLGFGASRLFCYAIQAERFEPEDFHKRIAPWLELEDLEHSESDFPREGIGCWNPIFPARNDDIEIMAGIALRTLENFALDPPRNGKLVVYTAHLQDGNLDSIIKEKEV